MEITLCSLRLWILLIFIPIINTAISLKIIRNEIASSLTFETISDIFKHNVYWDTLYIISHFYPSYHCMIEVICVEIDSRRYRTGSWYLHHSYLICIYGETDCHTYHQRCLRVWSHLTHCKSNILFVDKYQCIFIESDTSHPQVHSINAHD